MLNILKIICEFNLYGLFYFIEIKSIKLIYKKNTTYFIELYKLYIIVKYIDSNYTSNFKN